LRIGSELIYTKHCASQRGFGLMGAETDIQARWSML